eukprot:455309_1
MLGRNRNDNNDDKKYPSPLESLNETIGKIYKIEEIKMYNCQALLTLIKKIAEKSTDIGFKIFMRKVFNDFQNKKVTGQDLVETSEDKYFRNMEKVMKIEQNDARKYGELMLMEIFKQTKYYYNHMAPRIFGGKFNNNNIKVPKDNNNNNNNNIGNRFDLNILASWDMVYLCKFVTSIGNEWLDNEMMYFVNKIVHVFMKENIDGKELIAMTKEMIDYKLMQNISGDLDGQKTEKVQQFTDKLFEQIKTDIKKQWYESYDEKKMINILPDIIDSLDDFMLKDNKEQIEQFFKSNHIIGKSFLIYSNRKEYANKFAKFKGDQSMWCDWGQKFENLINGFDYYQKNTGMNFYDWFNAKCSLKAIQSGLCTSPIIVKIMKWDKQSNLIDSVAGGAERTEDTDIVL